MAKQKYLFHASCVCDLKKILPQKKTLPEGFENGAVVFATDDFAFATMFLVPHDDSWANGGAIGDTLYFLISDKQRFQKSDKGGSVYLVESKKFVQLNKREFYSKEGVNTFEQFCFSKGLMAMIINKVQVYFVDLPTYQTILTSSDLGASIMNSMVSENERLGFKIENLDIYTGSKKRISPQISP